MKLTLIAMLLVATTSVHSTLTTPEPDASGGVAPSGRCPSGTPESIAAAVASGDCLRGEKSYRAALEAYRRGLVISDRGSPELFLGMGLVYDELHQPKQMLQAMFAAYHLSPSDPEILYQLGIAYELLEQWPQAIESFKKTVEAKPNDGRAHRNIGFVLLQQDRPDEAIAPLEAALAIDDNDWKAHFNLSGAYNAIYDSLNDQMRQLPSRQRPRAPVPDPQVQAHDELAARLTSGDYRAKAYEHLQAAARINPDDYRIWYSMGTRLLSDPKTLPEAIVALQRGVAVKPNDYRLLRNLAIAQEKAGLREESYDTLERLLLIAPDDKEMLLMAARIANRIGRFDAAEAKYRVVVRFYGQEWAVHVEYGTFLHWQGRNVEAEEHARIAKALMPQQAKSIDAEIYAPPPRY